MIRSLIALVLTFAFAPCAGAQDMPLSQILIDGEGWKKVEGTQKAKEPGEPKPDAASRAWVTASVRSADGNTKYIALRGERYLYAKQVSKEGESDSAPYARYAPLRMRRGEIAATGIAVRGIAVTGLTTDKDGRIYAATEIGVQVFDPTGRLCGVLTPAAAGKPEFMAFEGDQLTLWIGETKYTRKLRTSVK